MVDKKNLHEVFSVKWYLCDNLNHIWVVTLNECFPKKTVFVTSQSLHAIHTKQAMSNKTGQGFSTNYLICWQTCKQILSYQHNLNLLTQTHLY